MYLISVYFDEKSNRILQKHIEAVAKRSGNTFMTEHGVPPHMTVFAIEARTVQVLEPAFTELKDKLRRGSIQIASVGQLLPYVMYAAPVLNDYLWKMSGIVCQTFQDIPETRISKYYMSGKWQPHVTLAKTLTKAQMREAFAALQEAFVPFEADVVEIGLARTNPHKDVLRWELS